MSVEFETGGVGRRARRGRSERRFDVLLALLLGSTVPGSVKAVIHPQR